MDSIISYRTNMCRICPNTLDLTDLSLPENDFIIKQLESFFFVEVNIFYKNLFNKN